MAGGHPTPSRRMAYVRWNSRVAIAVACLAAASIVMQPACKFLGPPDPSVVAEADVYSGRANPFWTVSGRDSVTLRRMVAALPADGAAPVLGLGYRGIVVHELHLVLRDCFELRVYRGTVVVQCDAGPRTLADAGRQVERFLAETGLKRADPSAYAVVQHDFAAAP